MKVLCLQTAKRSFTFARRRNEDCYRLGADVSKPLSGRSLLQGDKKGGEKIWRDVSKPLSGRSLLQGGETRIAIVWGLMSPNR
jgi:hypothetical protein